MSDDDLQDCDQVNNKTLHILGTAPCPKIYEFFTISKELNEIYTAKLCAKYKFPLQHYSRLKFDVFFSIIFILQNSKPTLSIFHLYLNLY